MFPVIFDGGLRVNKTEKEIILINALVNEFQWRRNQQPDPDFKEIFTRLIEFLLKEAEKSE